jgi:hypothetical protein
MPKLSNAAAAKVTRYPGGSQVWTLRGRRHREDGPAVICAEMNMWFRHGKLHREDGPAIIYTSGYKAWYLNGKLHREDGPAIIYADGSEFWYLDGRPWPRARCNVGVAND